MSWAESVLWPFLPPAVHPNDHTDHFHEPECVRSPRDALYAQSLCHHLPPRAQRAEEKAFIQSCCHSRHNVLPALSQGQRQTQWGGQDRAVWECRCKQWVLRAQQHLKHNKACYCFSHPTKHFFHLLDWLHVNVPGVSLQQTACSWWWNWLISSKLSHPSIINQMLISDVISYHLSTVCVGELG